MTLLNIFHSGGAIVIPILILIGIIVLVISGLRSSKSGSVTGGNYNNPRVESSENVPFVKTWQFKFVALLVVVFIIVLVVLGSDYKGV